MTITTTSARGLPQRRKLLLAVTGLSPQIVTETLYALAVRPIGQPWIPDEVHLVTTARGRDNARLALLSTNPGWFHRLRADYQLPDISFPEENIHVIRRADGSVIDDIKDEEDNRRAADGIASVVRRLTESPETEIHASIAGGRKTMGFFLGYAMSLFGRPQDRLSHVLVSEPFESNRSFYYPSPRSHPIPLRVEGSEMIDAHTAQVWLGDIPFARLRAVLPPEARLKADLAFSEAVCGVDRLLNPTLAIRISDRSVEVTGHRFSLPRAEFAFLLWATRRDLEGRPIGRHKRECEEAKHDASEYRLSYAALGIDPDETKVGRTQERLKHGLLNDFVDERLSAIKKRFQRELGEGRAEAFLLQRQGRKSESRYRFRLPHHHIHILE